MKKTIGEEELTEEQLEWLKNNKNHPLATDLYVTLNLANTNRVGNPTLHQEIIISKNEIKENMRNVFRNWRKMWEKAIG